MTHSHHTGTTQKQCGEVWEEGGGGGGGKRVTHNPIMCRMKRGNVNNGGTKRRRGSCTVVQVEGAGRSLLKVYLRSAREGSRGRRGAGAVGPQARGPDPPPAIRGLAVGVVQGCQSPGTGILLGDLELEGCPPSRCETQRVGKMGAPFRGDLWGMEWGVLGRCTERGITAEGRTDLFRISGR